MQPSAADTRGKRSNVNDPLKRNKLKWRQEFFKNGSGGGSVGRAVATNTRGLQFKSSQRQNLSWAFVDCQLDWTDENKEKKRPGMVRLKSTVQNKFNEKLEHVRISEATFSRCWTLKLRLKSSFVILSSHAGEGRLVVVVNQPTRLPGLRPKDITTV